MRVLLIQATGINRVNPEIVQPVGLMYLASALRPIGHDVRILDLRFHEGDLERTVSAYRPDVMGISGLTQDARLIETSARTARIAAPKSLIVLGGPHATAYWDKVLDETGADIAVPGEGDQTFPELLEAFDKGWDLDDVGGIVYRRNGAIQRTEHRPFIEDLDSLPLPAWDLIDVDRYCYDKRFVDLRARRRFMAVFSSRGCPYQCIYCHQIMGKHFRARSAENILKEIKCLYENYGIREIEFWDDVFNLDKPRAMTILEQITDSGMDITIAFRNGLRGDRLDSELLQKMRKAGVYHIAFAFEVGTDRMQKLIRKNLKIPRVLEAVGEAVDLGMFTRGFFMLGFPSEMREEIQATIDVAIHSRLHLASFFIVNAFRGSAVYDLAKQMGKTVEFEYDEYDYNAIRHSLCEVPEKELLRMQKAAYRRFFASPERLWRIARELPNRRQIPRYVEQLLRRMRFDL